MRATRKGPRARRCCPPPGKPRVSASYRDLLEALRDEPEIAGFYVSEHRRGLENDADYVPPAFRDEITGNDPPAETVDEDAVTASGPPPSPDVNEALLAALEHVADHLQATRADLARDREERNAQTDLLLDIGGRLEKVASRDDVAEAIAELIAALAKDSPRRAIEALREDAASLRADVEALGGEIAAAIGEVGRVFGQRLDTQRTLLGDEIAALRAAFDSKIEGLLPNLKATADLAQDSEERVMRSLRDTMNMLPAIAKSADHASLIIAQNASMTTAAAKLLAEVLFELSPTKKNTAKELAAAAAAMTGQTTVVHEVDRKSGDEIRATESAPPNGRRSLLGSTPSLGLMAALYRDEVVDETPDEDGPK